MTPIPCAAVPLPALRWRGAWRAATSDILPALALLGGALSLLALTGLSS